MPTYHTFARSARNFEEFARAKKTTVDTGLTYGEAVDACTDFNSHLSPLETETGTKLEFTEE
jgi:hypothetical protein